MFWGYNLRQVDEATRMAAVRSEELLCDQSLISGVSSAINVRSGYTIKLEQHYQTEVNKDYLVTSVRHRGHQTYAWFESEENATDSSFQGGTFYDCSFTAIDEKKQFRARRETPWPHISGTLNAIIDDEGSGKYAQLNDYGQYKVQLLFDLTSKNTNRGSSWIRMASPYAGQDHGMAFPLLKGTEVIIGFMGGDPDQPVILGAVPNSENPNVLNASNAHLGGFQSASGNYMIVNDTEGQESVHMWSPNGNTHFYIGNF
ncbi:MAG: type VI secretion system tip protein VgrG [Orrella sp.]